MPPLISCLFQNPVDSTEVYVLVCLEGLRIWYGAFVSFCNDLKPSINPRLLLALNLPSRSAPLLGAHSRTEDCSSS